MENQDEKQEGHEFHFHDGRFMQTMTSSAFLNMEYISFPRMCRHKTRNNKIV